MEFKLELNRQFAQKSFRLIATPEDFVEIARNVIKTADVITAGLRRIEIGIFKPQVGFGKYIPIEPNR